MLVSCRVVTVLVPCTCTSVTKEMPSFMFIEEWNISVVSIEHRYQCSKFFTRVVIETLSDCDY